ncbi:MAG: COX15/CtaA family protein [Chromatiales bacterium]|nr:COX15/CtaA family protein [Chromatiales bacterium]
MNLNTFHAIAKWAVLLALVVVLLGAYTRLSDSGLGCPDWPGCYGELTVPGSEADVEHKHYLEQRPLETSKAWAEMVHRYFAGTLGLVILALSVIAIANRKDPKQPVVLPLVLLALVIFQALLGMWTVTLMLKPVVVMGHLLGGLSTLALLAWLALRTGPVKPLPDNRTLASLRGLALLALILVAVQIALGGWTSANYAARACGSQYPLCLGQWWPAEMDFRSALTIWTGLGRDYEFGTHLSEMAKVAIQMLHRLGAIVVFLVVGWLVLRLVANGVNRSARNIGFLVGVLLLAQLALGMSNLWFDLPLPVATAHNGTGALLLLSMVLLNHALRPRKQGRARSS